MLLGVNTELSAARRAVYRSFCPEAEGLAEFTLSTLP